MAAKKLQAICLGHGVALTGTNTNPTNPPELDQPTITYTLTNFHGDTALVLNNQAIATSNLMAYGPFGESLPIGSIGSVPLDTEGNTEDGSRNSTNENMGWAADPTRKVESLFTIPLIQMGARVYAPTIGRFLQVDSIRGGALNAYVYAHDPVNGQDYSGMDVAYDTYDYVGRNSDAIGVGLIIGFGVCLALTGGGCIVATPYVVAAGATVTGVGAYHKTQDPTAVFVAVALDLSVGKVVKPLKVSRFATRQVDRSILEVHDSITEASITYIVGQVQDEFYDESPTGAGASTITLQKSPNVDDDVRRLNERLDLGYLNYYSDVIYTAREKHRRTYCQGPYSLEYLRAHRC